MLIPSFQLLAEKFGYIREPDTITDRLIIVREQSQNILISLRKEAIEQATEEQAIALLKVAANFASTWKPN